MFQDNQVQVPTDPLSKQMNMHSRKRNSHIACMFVCIDLGYLLWADHLLVIYI